ncbi:MAG: hypothetical protein P4L85_24850 [Paludisphaera borealis]|uniref:hypothetical protein n=1 Tax=Paludisphaera borealis TaxID=1387353 RepID=UPI00284BEA1A|nr:hypothetical protein [Paludisphaera borealis]MDR3622604.1 hypothetical protein [Paludisphaera borealis]
MAKKTDPKKAKTSAQVAKKEIIKVAAEDLPRRSIEEAKKVIEAIYRNYATNPVGWEEIAGLLQVKATTNVNRYPLWAAVAYGMLSKTENDTYEITETGRKIVAPEYPGDDTEGKVKALLTPRVLSKFYTDFNGHSLPEQFHFPNVLENRYQIPRDRTAEAIKLIIDNGLYAGVLQEQGAGTYLVRLEQSAIPITPGKPPISSASDLREPSHAYDVQDDLHEGWETVCFFITPIGDEGTEQRQHTDMILKHVVEPAAKEYGLQVIRADKIERSGLITQQIFEHLVCARVCVADLSFANANVFYELGVRHTCKLPSVQLIRKEDRIPFDVAQGRTIMVDTTDRYSITDRLASAQRELSQHLKHIMSSDHSEPGEDNPVHLYLPKLKISTK